MKQRNTILTALCFLLVAAIVVLFKHQTNAGSPADNSSETNGAGITDPRDDSAKSSVSRGESATTKRNAKMAAHLEALEIGRSHVAATWMHNATEAFAKTNQTLATDLGLSDEQAAKVGSLFVGRKKQLASMLASLRSDKNKDPQETVRQITALMRNKGLREDLAGILTSGQLAAFDAAEENQRRKTIEAKTDREMSAINAILTLDESRKQNVLAALSARAVDKFEEEADARAFMSLTYGEMSAVIDLSLVQGLAAGINPDLEDLPGFAYGSTEYFRWKKQERAERIESELSTLRHILDEDQLARYREHLENEMPR